MRGPTTGDLKKRVQEARVRQGTPQSGAVPEHVYGEVHSIEKTADAPGVARVRIKHGKQAKASKSSGHGNLGFDSRPESTAHMHIEDANRLKIGQKVHLRPHDGEYGGGSSDEFTQ